jgi:uroporphyrinogen decarboxylase
MVEGGGSKHFDKVRIMAAKEPEVFSRLMEVLVDATAAHLIAQARAGAEVLQIFDSWAGVLDEEGFDRWVIAPTKAIIGRVKKACPKVPIIGFPRGAGMKYDTYTKALPLDAVSLDYALPAAWAAKTLQPRMVVQGNLDPAVLFTDKKTITTAVRRLKKTLGRKPYIFNLGHGILPKTPVRNVEWLVKAVRGKTSI